MKCKEIERLVINLSEEDLSEEEFSEIEQHVLDCAKCARFQDDLKKIRIYLKKMTLPVPSPELVRQTQSMCHAKIRILHEAYMKTVGQNRLKSIPKYLWAALISLIVLTIMWMFPLLRDLKLGQTLSFQAGVVFALMIQNAVMLFFAPILIRRYRLKNQELGLV